MNAPKRPVVLNPEAIGNPNMTPIVHLPSHDDEHCGRGVCAAMAGHEGTCAEASGWDEEWPVETVKAIAAVTKGGAS